MSIADEVQKRLRALNSYDSLLSLLEILGYTFSGEPRSTNDWPPALQNAVSDFRLAAHHGNFGIFYLVIPEDHMLGLERQITAKILATEPHSIFVFTTPQHNFWHFVHVRYDELEARRRQLRRFVVDLRESRAANRLRTTAERLSKIAISPGEKLSVLEIQKRCDEAFRISEVTKSFLASFVDIVKRLTDSFHQNNPTLLPTDQYALRQAQLLMDRLVFLYFIQKKGRLSHTKCTIPSLPSLDQPAQSLNHAYRLVSEAFEPQRISHVGNVFEKILYIDSKKGLRPLDDLRSKFEAQYEQNLHPASFSTIKRSR